ncbi:MAG: hypothetical protein IPJ84_15740 [Bdellovibrionales bacterium]|nr:hypothetical protein [Bdellovibrionales bacterium]
MDFRQTIITFLGLQDVKIIDLKVFKKLHKIEVKVQQNQGELLLPIVRRAIFNC